MEYSFQWEKIPATFSTRYTKSRDCLSKIEEYVNSTGPQSQICAVYGLRRTGKTVLLQQCIENLDKEKKEKALFVECIDHKTDFYELLSFLKKKIDEGYLYFFIDEITYAEGFQKMATVLSDVLVGMHNVKIVTTGTDSLGLSLPSKSTMYDRIKFVNTTETTFGEYFKLTGVSTLDGFLQKGSTLRTDIFEDYDNAKDYVETAVVANIVNSLKKGEDLYRYSALLTSKYDDEVLINEIQRIVNRYSQVRTLSAITKQFHSTPLGDARDFVLKHERNGLEIVAKLKYEEVNRKIAEILGCSNPSGMEAKDVQQLYNYLQEIKVFSNIPVQDDVPLEMVTHPGLFHANLKYTLNELQKDDSWIEVDNETKNMILSKAYQSALGKMMENIVISDTYNLLCQKKVQKDDLFGESTGRWYVSKYAKEVNGRRHEVDLLIFDKKTKNTYLFEIKHSKENVPNQSIHLESEDFLQEIERDFGPIKTKAVLYNGYTDTETDIPRISARDFLVELYNESRIHLQTKDISLENVLHKLHSDGTLLCKEKECITEKEEGER